MHPEDYIVSRLASIGLRPEDIELLVATHFDPDHAGNHELFPHAEFVVQRRHYEVARAGDPRAAVVREHWDAPALRYRLVDGDTVLVPGVELLETSGHVPGHQSVLVRLPETGPVLLTIDAVPAESMQDPDTRVLLVNDEDEAETRASTRKVAEIAQREGVTLIVYGHDAQQWPTLRQAPEFYEWGRAKMREETAAPTRSAKEQFDRQAAQYDRQWNTWSEETLGWLLRHADPRASDFVLDVATGTGFTALAFAPRVQTVIGLDVSSGMLEQARRQAGERRIANAVFQEGTAESLPFADGSFDIVTCRVAPHHFLDTPKFLTEAARVLKPGGRLMLVDTTVPDDSPEVAQWQNKVEAVRDPSHVRNYTPGVWRRMTEAAGLTVAECGSGGGGITIPLSDWITKAGCTPEQTAEVHRRFAEAPPSARAAFQIETMADGETVFTWQRVTLKALKPAQEG